MDDGQEQDQYEEQLKELFNTFDTSGCGSLSPEELSDLCQSLRLEDATPTLLHALLQNQDRLTARVDFDQFKNALILVLSSSIEPPQAEEETFQKPESPEIQPKFVKGSKRYGRRSTPDLVEPISDLSEVTNVNPAEGEDLEDNYDSAVPRKRERWNAHESNTEEYEAEGQMHLWNPDEPSTPRGSVVPLPTGLEERLREACEELNVPWDRCADHTELLDVCEHLGLEINEDFLQSLTGGGVMNVQELVSRVVNHNKPPTPSASTPYRQLKRHHSTQPFDEGGRRIAASSVLTSTIGMRLFSILDDGTGFTPAEHILDAWIDEGIENSTEILQALNFDLDGKLSLGDLTMALENELLLTKNGIHQAALASFRAEIRHLLERVDRELREKEKIRSDLEKAEKLKTQLATEVDEHHSAIEHTNNLKLRKLEQEQKEKLAAVRSELMQEMDQIQQQAGLQREELEAEIEKIREDESFLRDHLSISVKENRRLEMDVLDSTDKLVEAQSHISKLQTSLEKVMKEKFGDLDPGSAEFFLQEERMRHLSSGHEAQCRELQDRIDELQSELQEFHSLGRVHQPCNKPLSEELESKSPGMESDPGIGSEEVQPFSMSLEAEMMMEQLKEQHLQEMEQLRNQLETKINDFDTMVDQQRATQQDQNSIAALQYQQEVQALREELASFQSHAQELQSQLKQVELERLCLERRPAEEREALEKLQEEEVGNLRQQLLEAHTCTADLEEQLKNLEAEQSEADEIHHSEIDVLKKQHAAEMKKLEEEHVELSKARLGEEMKNVQEERAELEKRFLDECETQKEQLQLRHEIELKAKLEEVRLRFEEQQEAFVQRLTQQWEKERAQLDEQNNESLQVLLEEEMLRLVKEQEEKDGKLTEQWETERARLQEHHRDTLHERILEERLQLQEQFEQKEKRLKEEWERERLQLEEDYEGMFEDRLNEEREKLETEREDVEKRLENSMAEERALLEESHREAMKERTAKHSEERNALSSMLDKLRDDMAQERREIQISFTHRIKEVEERFSGDQELVTERFQADVLKLDQHYQRELRALSESHEEQRRHWEAQMQEAFENAEEHRRLMEEEMEQERESLTQEWTKERRELESLHKKELDKVIVRNRQLQKELDDFISLAQTKEIELSRQLNDLHNRLQESLEVKDQLLAQSESKALQAELLLNQTVEDFKQERTEHLSNQLELEDRYNEMLGISEGQITERIGLLTERDNLKMKIEELELLLKQAVEDFELERKELQEHASVLEEKLKDNVENDKDDLRAEREMFTRRIQELEEELDQVSTSMENDEKTEIRGSNDLVPFTEENENIRESISFSGEEQKTCPSPENQIDDFVESSNQELDCSSPFLDETVMDALDAEHRGPENIINVCHEYDNEVPATDDDSEDPEQDNQMAPTENIGEESENQVVSDCLTGDLNSDEAEDDAHVSCCSTETGLCSEEGTNSNHRNIENKKESVSVEMQCEAASSLEVFEDEDADADGEKETARASCEDESKPQDDSGSFSHEDEPCHETVAEPPVLGETGDPGELSLEDPEVNVLPNNSHRYKHEAELVSDSDCEHLTTKRKDERADCSHDCLQHLEKDGDCENQDAKLQGLYSTATEENVLLHEKISLLQQKTEILESLLAHNSEKIKTGHQVLEENYSLKVKMVLLMEHVKGLEIKALKMTDLQIRYEDCMCENAKLKEQNCELEKSVWSLETRMNIFHDFQDEQLSLVDEISRMREENARLSGLFGELEQQYETLSAMHPDAGRSQSPTGEDSLDLTSQPEVKVQAVSDLENCCEEFEKQNSKLRRAVTELQDKSQTLDETTQAHRSEACRLAEENLLLRQRIAALKEQDLKEAQGELTRTLEHLRNEKGAAHKAAEHFQNQIAELRLQGQQLEDENGILSERHFQNIADKENLRQQLAELMKEKKRREALPAEDKNKLAACVSSLEAELTKALEDTAQLEDRNTQLSQQLYDLREKAVKLDSMENKLSHVLEERRSVDLESQGLRNQLAKAQERVKTVDETCQAVNHQSSRLKADVRVLQKERDSLKREVAVLHKRLLNSNDKNHVLEMALHSSGLHSPSRKLYRDEMSRLMDQEQQLLRQENERLQAEVRNIKGDMVQSREKVRQLDATILSLKQHRHPSQSLLVKALEQENTSLKQELEAQKEQTKGCEAGRGHTELESLQQENEALKVQMARLSTQLLESFQAHLVGLLPPSPHRIPRGQHRGDEPDNMQDDRQRKMKNMEERMREIELSLHNVKLLLKEKVSQLKDQLNKNGKADVLIEDLYVENAQLLKALEITEQRHKIAEKKNYLLEEKISSLNKIVRDLNPSPLPPLPYHYKCS
ncbi:ninein isoform X1 [Hippoglossus stenolepis]|uniref:ninein isoform X1 n=1 Tax=Hippoglossus stenolepis TaxID=195615 RepID=UPI001FAF756B|nr:ninein isoform X1 [Hippoglossus stenolepis]XP_035023849.2 ninein isoform X1 [Hippoglossus stenolepis]